MKNTCAPACCPPKSPFTDLKSLPRALAGDIRKAFAMLASIARIRLLHALVRLGEAPVGDVARAAGLKIAAASNQLRRMAAAGVVGSRREGKQVIYFMVDPCVAELLDRGACLAIDSRRRKSGK